MEKRKRRVCPSPLGCELVRNSVVKPSIYRRMERKKKTMKEIKKEKEEKWNVSGRKEMVSGMVEMKSYGNEPFI